MSKKNVKQERTVKYAYLRDERDSRRVMTIARRWGKNGNRMRYGYALCHPLRDQFNKVDGRFFATLNMEDEPRKIRPAQGEFILRAIIEDIANDDTVCNRNASTIARQWLDENDRRMEEEYLTEYSLENTDTSDTLEIDGCAGEDECSGSCEGCVEYAGGFRPAADSSLKAALEGASQEVRESPDWLRSIHSQNDALEARRTLLCSEEKPKARKSTRRKPAASGSPGFGEQ